MNHHPASNLFRRAAVLTVALCLIACAAGLGYVVHVTRQTAQHVQTFQPSLLPLAAMAFMAAVAGFAVLRAALHAPDGETL